MNCLACVVPWSHNRVNPGTTLDSYSATGSLSKSDIGQFLRTQMLQIVELLGGATTSQRAREFWLTGFSGRTKSVTGNSELDVELKLEISTLTTISKF